VFVIPNPRRLRVRDLLFARKPRKKQIPNPVKNRTGFGMTYFNFIRTLLGHFTSTFTRIQG
jgi:hypothetical protein